MTREVRKHYKNIMIVHQWEEQGVRRLHLGILTRRQFDLSDRRLRGTPGAGQPGWLIDDFSGSWIDSDPLTWLKLVSYCVAAVAAAPGRQRHAVVLPPAMLERLASSVQGADEAFRLFDCPAQAMQWAR